MKSIRAYLLTRLLGGTALVLVAAGCAVYFVVTRSIQDQFDANLGDRVQAFASILFQVEDHVEFEFSDELMPEYEPGDRPDYFELWFEDGRLLEHSNSLVEADLLVPGTPGDVPTYWTAALPDGRQGRYVARTVEVHHVYPEEGPDRPDAARITVVVARGREGLTAAERTALLYCAVGSLALILLIAVLSWRAVARGLEPTSRLAAALDAIEVNHLPECLDVGALPAELAPVANTMNALIKRVDAALKRERRTTADIAHELRTPLSELLTVSEVALRNGDDPAETKRALGTVRDAASRMGRSVSSLLKLARLEMGAETFDHGEVDLGDVVEELFVSFGRAERERGVQVRNLVAPGELVEGDRSVLRIVVSNLLSNALNYSPAQGVVECRMERAGDDWSLRVENEAEELRTEDLAALTEPFWRKDRARSDRNRSGLGLALARALAEKTGLQLRFELQGGRFIASLRGDGANGTPGS